jgi:hypothetical protein
VNNGISIDKGIGEGEYVAVIDTTLRPCYLTIWSNSKVIVPCTTYRSIGITNRDGGRGIVADNSIGSGDSNTSNRVNPDNDGCILTGTGTYRSTVIIKDVWLKEVNDLMDNSIIIGQGICIRSSGNADMINLRT